MTAQPHQQPGPWWRQLAAPHRGADVRHGGAVGQHGRRLREGGQRLVRRDDQLATHLQGQGVRLILAHDIGQVRDVLRHAGEPTAVPVYPTVDEAVAAAGTRTP